MEKHLFGNTCMRLESFLFSFTGSVRRAPASHCDFISFHFAKFYSLFHALILFLHLVFVFRAYVKSYFSFNFYCGWTVHFFAHLELIGREQIALTYSFMTRTHCTHATKHYNQIIYGFNMLITNGFHIIFFRELPWRFVCCLTFNSALLLFFMIHIPRRFDSLLSHGLSSALRHQFPPRSFHFFLFLLVALSTGRMVTVMFIPL